MPQSGLGNPRLSSLSSAQHCRLHSIHKLRRIWLCSASVNLDCSGPILRSCRRSQRTTDSPTDSPWERRRGFRQTCQIHELRRPTKANLLGRRPDIRSCFGLPIPTHPIQCASTLHPVGRTVTIRRTCSGETTAAIWPEFSPQSNSRPKLM